MGRHNAPKRPSRAVPMLGGGAAALATAASLAALQTIPVSSADVYEAGPTNPADTALASEASDVAGPLAIPTIGVVAPGFDRLVTLLGLPTPTPTPDPTDYQVGVWTQPTLPPTTPADAHGHGSLADRPGPRPDPTDPPSEDPGPDRPDRPPVRDPGSDRPDGDPGSDRPDGDPGPDRPDGDPGPDRPDGDPGPDRPDGDPGPDRPDRDPGPDGPDGDPTEEPPTEPEPPANVFLAFGESLDVVDAATGGALYSITVVGVTPDVACTAAGATAAENGHLVAVQLLVTTGVRRRGR